MADKLVYKAEDVRSRVLAGIDFIVNPVASTLGPRGNNVLWENDHLDPSLSNDGATVAKQLSSKDRIIQSVVEVIRSAALRTNSDGGDGTTTTTLLSGVLTKEVLKMIDQGYSWLQIRSALDEIKTAMLKRIEKSRVIIKGKEGLKEVATISANNDPKIAEDVVKAIEVAGLDGMVFLEGNNKQENEIIQDLGFMVQGGIQYPELLVDKGRPAVVFKNVPVLITDKRLYYSEEAETILRVAVQAGWKNVVIVARDFMGEAVNTFIANHTRGVINVMLVKAADTTEKNTEQIQDLSIYLSGKIISDKTGSLVNKITAEDFVIVNQAYSDPTKTLFTPKTSGGKALKERIKMLKTELDKKKDDPALKARIASLTTGVVTIKIGGTNPIEIREKVFRYEDAIHATRAAMREGYLVGGGLSFFRAYSPTDLTDKSFVPLYKKYAEAVVRKIAENAGQPADTVIKEMTDKDHDYGYNALTDTFEDLRKAGVIEPYLVAKLAVENSIAVATILASVKYYIVNDIADGKDEEAGS